MCIENAFQHIFETPTTSIEGHTSADWLNSFPFFEEDIGFFECFLKKKKTKWMRVSIPLPPSRHSILCCCPHDKLSLMFSTIITFKKGKTLFFKTKTKIDARNKI